MALKLCQNTEASIILRRRHGNSGLTLRSREFGQAPHLRGAYGYYVGDFGQLRLFAKGRIDG